MTIVGPYYHVTPAFSLTAAVPFNADVREGLGAKYGLKGIPAVVLLHAATGAPTGIRDARERITGASSLKGLFR